MERFANTVRIVQPNMADSKSLHVLQWMCQNYVCEFVFAEPRRDINDAFMEDLTRLIAQDAPGEAPVQFPIAFCHHAGGAHPPDAAARARRQGGAAVRDVRAHHPHAVVQLPQWRHVHVPLVSGHCSQRLRAALHDIAQRQEEVGITDKVTISALQGNAGAGGAMMALAADIVWAHSGVIVNPHYKVRVRVPLSQE